MAKPVEGTDNNFEQIINTDKPVLVDFWATWCGPCRMISPLVEELADEYEGKAVVAKVDVDANPQLSIKYGIRSIPALMVFKNGIVVEKLIGVQPKSTLVSKLNPHL